MHIMHDEPWWNNQRWKEAPTGAAIPIKRTSNINSINSCLVLSHRSITLVVVIVIIIMGYVGVKRKTTAFLSLRLIFLFHQFSFVLKMGRPRIKSLIAIFSISLSCLVIRQSLDRFENDPALDKTSEEDIWWAYILKVKKTLIFRMCWAMFGFSYLPFSLKCGISI